jgi:hypothetical protein
MLDQLVALYEPVPFDHKTHAAMAEMWDGCTTCHHRTPSPSTVPANARSNTSQANAASIPACKSCHPASVASASLHQPSLKGAYHRQCLNCHREWANDNSCEVCHKLRDPKAAVATTSPSVDDIVGRMHPPIPEPDVKIYRARFTPAVGANAIFRHKEHTTRYGLKCVSCHRRDNCADCHNGVASTLAHKPINPGRTWADSHAPCASCHQQDRCAHCHYDSDKAQPIAFEHRATGQLLDSDHQNLKCGQCHNKLKSKTDLTCGDAACHESNPAIAFPAHRPGEVVTTRPAPTKVAIAQPTTAPATRAVIKRIRR